MHKTPIFRVFSRLLSTLTPFGYKMVRFFQNPFEDYKPGTNVAFDTSEIIQQIEASVNTITKRFTPTRNHVDGGLYVGVSGVAYMFYCLAKNPMLSDKKAFYLEKALEYIRPALENSAGDKTSFLLGDAGTFALASVLLKEVGDDSYVEPLHHFTALYPHYLNPKFLKCGGDELFVGRAGYLAGALWITGELKIEIIQKEELYQLCDLIVQNGRNYSKKHKSPCPLMYHYYNTEYLGAAHGISFILQMLLTVPGYLQKNTSAAQDIKAAVEFLAQLQTDEGNWPCCMEELSMCDHKLVHWCHGAPGTVYLMAKAYLVYKEAKYLDACIKAGELVWRKGLLRKGPGICHGVAGNGYVFLLLHHLTKDEKYLFRAKRFADFLNNEEFLRDARLPDNPESLYEGTAGAVCYLSDLLVPDKATFPFMDVFANYNYV